MVRSIFSAAAGLIAIAGVTGCTNSAHFVKNDPVSGVAIVSVPQSDWCQWYYKHEALEFIRTYNPSFKDKDIVVAGEVPVGQLLDSRPVGPDGKPAVDLNKNGDKEYQIVYRLPPKTTVTTVNGMPMGVSGLNQAPPMNTGVMPTGGVQNLGMPPTGVQNLSMPPTSPPTFSSPGLQPSPGGPAMPGGFGSR